MPLGSALVEWLLNFDNKLSQQQAFDLGQHLFDAGILGGAELNDEGLSPLVDILHNDERYFARYCLIFVSVLGEYSIVRCPRAATFALGYISFFAQPITLFSQPFLHGEGCQYRDHGTRRECGAARGGSGDAANLVVHGRPGEWPQILDHRSRR